VKPFPLALACFTVVASAALHAQQAAAPAETPAAAAPAQPDFHRAPAQWNVEDEDHAKLALQGWDPVAYFPEGGGKPAEGSEKISVVQGGITYRFASDEHRKLFVADPWKYEPAYGGWCAYAMAKGEKVEVDPESFRILDGRLFVFYDGLFANTRKSWLEGEAALLAKSDAAWVKLSGEKNRGDTARAEAVEAAKGG
jgi:YHS domain-containing protein